MLGRVRETYEGSRRELKGMERWVRGLQDR